MKKLIVGLNGAGGKMGLAISQLATEQSEYDIRYKLTKQTGDFERLEAIKRCDVIVDFSNEEGTARIINLAQKTSAALLIGTTNLSEDLIQKIKQLAHNNAILYASNTSIGANLISMLAGISAKILGNNYDAEIIELHHRFKQDAPSGTALMIGKEIAKAGGIDFDKKAVFGRRNNRPRREGEIGFSSIRAGGIYGDHQVIFGSENELITIGCSAISRNAFAQGALLAAKWLYKQQPGYYVMQDFLGFGSPESVKL